MEHSHEYGCKVSISYGNPDALKVLIGVWSRFFDLCQHRFLWAIYSIKPLPMTGNGSPL